MALIKCAKCGKEISDNAPDCIYCGNLLNQNMFNNENDSVSQNCGNPLPVFEETETNEIMENIEKIKEAANIIDILLKVVAVILFIVGFFCLFGWGDIYEVIAICCGITGPILLVISNFIKPFIKWKAYMLETNYKISKNTECEKNGFNKL